MFCISLPALYNAAESTETMTPFVSTPEYVPDVLHQGAAYTQLVKFAKFCLKTGSYVYEFSLYCSNFRRHIRCEALYSLN